MLISLAWRNLARNRRRSFLTGAAVAFAVLLVTWMLGMNQGAYAQMIGQAVNSRLGHLQVMSEGYLENPEPENVVREAAAIATHLKAIDGVRAVSQRALAEGMLARDSETAPVDLLGIDVATEREASVVADKMLSGEKAVRWCHERMADALEILGNDEELFGRWCEAVGESRYLPDDQPRGIVIGTGVAEALLVSVGDEVTLQVVRAVDTEGAEGEGRERAGDLSQRRLVVTGLFRTGQSELDNRAAYLHRSTLSTMLGTNGPNEIVILLDNIGDLERVRTEASVIVDRHDGARVHSWNERNPGLSRLIEMDAGQNGFMYVILCLLVTLGVVNATMMSVLERTKEFGVVLALGARRHRLFNLIMTEVALLGVLAVAVGAVLGAGIELFGRFHGWKMEWFGYDAETLESMTASGVNYDAIYYAALTPDGAIGIVVGVYLMFILAGLGTAALAVIGYLQPAIRNLEQDVPDSLLDTEPALETEPSSI